MEKMMLLKMIGENPKITAKEMACRMSVSSRTVERVLSDLLKNGVIERTGSTKSGEWKIIKEMSEENINLAWNLSEEMDDVLSGEMKKSEQLSEQLSEETLIDVVIVDDHKVMADGLGRLLNESATVRVIATVYSAAECWQLLTDGQPDVLMLDIGLPDGNGIDMCPVIKEKYPQLKVLMLTNYGELAAINRALDAGADGYVLKNSETEELLEGIRMVASGERFLCDEVNVALKKSVYPPLVLTRREIELLQLIKDGLTLPELADKMCLGIQTIRSYRKTLNVKLDAHNTAQLLQNAKALGLV